MGNIRASVPRPIATLGQFIFASAKVVWYLLYTGLEADKWRS